MGKKGRKKKEIIPFFLVQYHQYQKCISFARARDFYASREWNNGSVMKSSGRQTHLVGIP